MSIPKILKFRISALRIPRSRRSVLLTVTIGLLLLVGITAALTLLLKPSEEVNTRRNYTDAQLQEKIAELDEPGTSCKKIAENLGHLSSEGRSATLQKELLRRQIYCLSDQRQYDLAIKAAEMLKNIYIQEGNTSAATALEATISSFNENKKVEEALKNVKPTPVQ